MARDPVRVSHAQWNSLRDFWHGHVEGRDLGTGVTVLFYANKEKGKGPGWHVHPYDEVFIIREGRALFTIGETRIEAETGDVLLGPAGIPHKFANIGEGRLDTVDIHLSDRWIQTDLPDPETA